MSGGMYILDYNGVPLPEPDMLKWADWYESDNRIIEQTKVGPMQVSTIFLGIDHNFGAGPPLLWETRIFFADHMARYSSREEAVAGHMLMVARARKLLEETQP